MFTCAPTGEDCDDIATRATHARTPATTAP